jgi:hypothetical protein
LSQNIELCFSTLERRQRPDPHCGLHT